MSEFMRGFSAGLRAAADALERQEQRKNWGRYDEVSGDPRCTCAPYTSEEDATWHMRDCPADPNSRIPRRAR